MTMGNVLNNELIGLKSTVERLEKIIVLYKELIAVMDFGEIDTLTNEEKEVIKKQYDDEISRQKESSITGTDYDVLATGTTNINFHNKK